MNCHYKRPDLCKSTPLCCMACATAWREKEERLKAQLGAYYLLLDTNSPKPPKKSQLEILFAEIKTFFDAAWKHLKREYMR